MLCRVNLMESFILDLHLILKGDLMNITLAKYIQRNLGYLFD